MLYTARVVKKGYPEGTKEAECERVCACEVRGALLGFALPRSRGALHLVFLDVPNECACECCVCGVWCVVYVNVHVYVHLATCVAGGLSFSSHTLGCPRQRLGDVGWATGAL